MPVGLRPAAKFPKFHLNDARESWRKIMQSLNTTEVEQWTVAQLLARTYDYNNGERDKAVFGVGECKSPRLILYQIWYEHHRCRHTYPLISQISQVRQWLCGRVPDLQFGGCSFESRPGLLRTKVYSAFHPSGVGK